MNEAETAPSTKRGIYYSSSTSPFARKVRIVMDLRGVADHFDEVDCDPFIDDPGFLAANPIRQVPALMTADGHGIIGSALICAYLDTIGDAPPIASAPAASWDALCRQAVADGVMECSVRLRAERMLRAENERSPYWIARWAQSIAQGLDHLEANLPAEGAIDIGLIATACAALYLDLRHPDLEWRKGRPLLADRIARLEEQEVFAQTNPALPLPGSTRERIASRVLKIT